MSGNNDQPNVEALALVALGMAFVVVFFIACALLILAAFVASMISICGWTRDIEFGPMTIRKEYCRAFIPMGVLGEIVIALLITFIESAGIAVDATWSTYLIGGAYAVFSLGGTALLGKLDVWPEKDEPEPVSVRPAIPPETDPRPVFRYAEWDDHIRR
jgi:hypothetical protein